MKSKLKSLLALILAMCMALSLLSTTVWAAEDGSVSAGDGSVAVQEEESPAEESEAQEEEAPAEESEAQEEESPAEEPEAEEDEAPAEEPEAEEDEAPAEQPEAQEEEAPVEEPEAAAEAQSEESAPAEADEAPAEEAEESAEAAVEAQNAPAYYPSNLTVPAVCVDSIKLTWSPGTLPGNAGTDELLLEGRDVTTNGEWRTVYNTTVSNARSITYHTLSGNQAGALDLVTQHEYEFRICYTSGAGERGTESVSGKTYLYNKEQEQTLLKQRIQNYLTVGLSAEEGENKVYQSAYDEKGLTANQTNQTELFYNRPLYQLDVKFTGTSESTDLSSPGTLLNFHATYASRVANNVPKNGFVGGADATVEGLDFRLEGLWFIDKTGQEKFQSLSESASSEQDFTVNLSEMGNGCNYIKLRMICYGYDTYGTDQYWVEEPLYFNVGVAATPLNTYSALTTKNAITLKPCINYSGTLSYDNALPVPKGNVSESGVFVWYRKKGTSKWSKKTFKGTKVPVLSKLKPDTVYQWKAQYYMKSTDHTGTVQTITAPETKVFSVCTAVSAKPKVKSCKVSGVKVVKHKIDAHWEKSGTNSIKRVKEQIWYTTDFKVTYTFANASKNIKGYTRDGAYSPLKGGKVTFNMSVNSGKKKVRAKKFSTKLQSCTNINGPGYSVSGLSPALKYTGKI